MTELPFLILAGILGASAASFGQCVLSRSMQGKSWVNGRSYCDYCRHPLSWYENLPIFSFLIQKGKTQCCHKKISPTYVIGEITLALVAMFLTALA